MQHLQPEPRPSEAVGIIATACTDWLFRIADLGIERTPGDREGVGILWKHYSDSLVRERLLDMSFGFRCNRFLTVAARISRGRAARHGRGCGAVARLGTVALAAPP